jgi:hypothetical protein
VSAGLAKLLDKAFVLGYVLPAIVFLTTLIALFGCPGALCDTAKHETNPFAELTYAVLAVYFIAVVLMALNYGLYRLFEGYLPPISWFEFARSFHRRRLAQRKKKIADLGNDPRADVMEWQLRKEYPESESEVLPTAFGNAIRAFEVYPAASYGADSISVWPRLLSVVSKDFQALINDAKALVDLGLNVSAFALAVFVFSVIVVVLEHSAIRIPVEPPKIGSTWTLVALYALVVAIAAYNFAISLVPDWGEQIKSAFDCYLPALAKQLGYAMPTNPAARRDIWERLSGQLLYGEPFDPPYAAGAEPAKPPAAADAPEPEAPEPDDEDEYYYDS